MTASLPLDLETADRIQSLLPLWLAQPNARSQRESIIRGLKPLVLDPALRVEVQRRAIDLSQIEADRKFWADPVGATERERRLAYKSLTPERALEQLDPKRQRLKLKVTPPELVWCAEATTDDLHLEDEGAPEDSLAKAAHHKYIKRVPTGKPRPKYRYFYKLPKTKGLTSSDDLKIGAKVKVSHAGQVGHFEILGHDQQKGLVRVKHDESGRTAHIREGDLHRMVQSYHRAKVEPLKLRTQSTQARLPGTKAPSASDNPPPPTRQKREVTRGTLGDLTSGVYDQIEGFGTEGQVRALAEGLSADRRYAVISQPGGWVLASGAKHEPMTGGARPGNATDLFFRGTGRRLDKYQGQWILVEADDLVASHDPVTFSVRTDYPKDVQERAYHEQKGEQEKVVNLAQTLEPAMIINDNPDAVNGAPIAVELDGKLVVLGGNGRTMGMQRAYKQDLETAAALKRHLATRAHAYGFSAADVRRLKAPLLVRRMTPKAGDTDDLRTLGRRMNESFTQGLDARAEEVALGKAFVNRDVLDTLTAGIGDDQTLPDYLASSKSRDFVAACMRAGLIDDRNKTKFVDQRSGLLNEDGRARIERVLAARLVPDASLLNRMMPSVREHLARSTAALVAAESNGWDLKAPIEAAVRADIDLRARRGGGRAATRDYLAQLEDTSSSTVATRVQTDPIARAIFVALRHYGGSTKTPAAFRGVALRARQASVNGGALGLALPGFSREPEKPVDAVTKEFGIGSEWMGQERLAASLEVASWRKAKGGADLEQPNRAVNRAAWLTRALVDAHTGSATGAGEHPTLPVAVIVRVVLRDLRRAVKTDPQLAADLARSPVTESTIRGFLEVFARQHAQELAKALGRPVVRMALGERGEDLYKRRRVLPNQMDLLSWRAAPEVPTKIDTSLPAMTELHAKLDWLTRQSVDPYDLQEWAPAFKTHAELAEAAKLMVEVGQQGARARDAQTGELPDPKVAATYGTPPSTMVGSGGKTRAKASGVIVQRSPQRPPGAGWQLIPGGKKGGYRRRKGRGWEYWYSGKGVTPGKTRDKPRSTPDHTAEVADLIARLAASRVIDEAIRTEPHEDTPKMRAARRMAGQLGEDYRILASPGRRAELEEKIANLATQFPSPPGPTPELPPGPQKPHKAEPRITVRSGRTYEDVGEKIGGARKDIAALAKLSRDDLEKDPTAAYKMVTKKTVFGTWDEARSLAERDAGVDPEAAWWKREILTAIVNRPADDPDARERYRKAAQLLDVSFARIKTVPDLNAFMQEWQDVMRGDIPVRVVTPDAPDFDKYRLALQMVSYRDLDEVYQRTGLRYTDAAAFGWELKEKEGIVKGQLQPDGSILLIGQDAERATEYGKMTKVLGRKFAEMLNIKMSVRKGYRREITSFRSTDPTINVFGSGTYRFRGTNGRDKAVQRYLKGFDKEDPWAWASEEKKGAKKDTGVKRQPGKKGGEFVFQRTLGAVERKGLPAVAEGADGATIMGELGIRAVEYGNWATDDERQWHTEMAHAGLKDLASVLGIPEKNIAVNGRLALAFGARGKGGKRAAAAHYEPGKQVINLTKMMGNGTLAHEYGHFLDHAISMAYNPGRGVPTLVSEGGTGEANVPTAIRKAFRGVLDAIKYQSADERREAEQKISELTSRILEVINQIAATPEPVKAARRAGHGKHFGVIGGEPPPGGWRAQDRAKGTPLPEGVTFEQVNAYADLVNERAKLLAERRRLSTDRETPYYKLAQERGKYYAKNVELFARAFESYIESTLEDHGQRSSYLVDGTLSGLDGVYLKHGSPHRARVNAAMAELISTLKSHQQFVKSVWAPRRRTVPRIEVSLL